MLSVLDKERSALLGRAPPIVQTYAKIVLIAVFFFAVEALLTRALSSVLIKLLKSSPKDEKAKATVTLAVARIVGFLHNAVQIPLGLVLLFDPRINRSHVTGRTELSDVVMLISAGYFLHDLIMCAARFNLEGPLYTLHALVCHAAYTYGLHTGFLHFHGAAFLQWENSTHFVHLRWFLYKMKLDHTQFYIFNGIMMVLSFFLARIVWGYYVAYVLVTDVVGEWAKPTSPFPHSAVIAYCVAAVIMTCLNSFWFYKMADRALDVLARGKKATEVGREKDE